MSVNIFNKTEGTLTKIAGSGNGDGDSAWEGTQAEWEALDTEEKAKYKTVYFTDDTDEDSGISMAVWRGTLSEWEALDKTTLADNTIITFTDDMSTLPSRPGFIDTDNSVLDVYSSSSTTAPETKEWVATDDCYVLVVLTTIEGTPTTKAYLNDVVMASNGSSESWSRSGFYVKKGQTVKVVGRFSILAYGLL